MNEPGKLLVSEFADVAEDALKDAGHGKIKFGHRSRSPVPRDRAGIGDCRATPRSHAALVSFWGPSSDVEASSQRPFSCGGGRGCLAASAGAVRGRLHSVLAGGAAKSA